MSAALDAALVQIDAMVRRKTREAARRDARRFIADPGRMADVVRYIDELDPEDVIPTLRERWLGARERFRAGHWTASKGEVTAARSALIAARYLRRFGAPPPPRRDFARDFAAALFDEVAEINMLGARLEERQRTIVRRFGT